MVQNRYSAKLVQFPMSYLKGGKIGLFGEVRNRKEGGTEWASPIVCVPKKDGSICICGDFKVSVNQVLLDIPYPLPDTEDIFAKSGSGTVFSKNDLSTAYQ